MGDGDRVDEEEGGEVNENVTVLGGGVDERRGGR